MKKLILTLLLISPLATAGGQTVISPVNVISMSDGSVATGQSIAIKDGIIVSVAPAGQDDAADGDNHIDGANLWVIPGLAEMHAHVPSKQRGEQYTRDILALYLANGVTTIRGMLGEPWHLELRSKLESGEWTGPRLLTSGPSFNGRSVTSPEQAASRVRQQAEAGYDFLKIHPGLERDEFISLVQAAREVKIPIAGHVSFETGLDTALHYRQDCIDHLDGYAQSMVPNDSSLAGVSPSWFGLNLADGMDASRAAALATQTALAGVWNVPTQSLFETTTGETGLAELEARPGMEFLSPGLKDNWRRSVENVRSQSTQAQRERFLDARRALIFALQDSGAGLLLGSDAPQIMNVPGFSVHQELEALVNAGLTPLQALQTGTINVARYFGDRDRGEIGEGQVADLILLRSNPLDVIDASTEIEGVMRAGKWFDRASLDAMLLGVRERGI